MEKPDYDIVADVKKRLNSPYDKYGLQAKKASENGQLKLISEFILEPYGGRGFEIKKGQVVRYELISGPQIIDTFYMAKERPMDEWADSFNTASFCGHTQFEGAHYYSNTPWVRPLLTLARDTVDNKAMQEKYGEAAAHSYVIHNGACNSGMWEAIYGIPNANSCHFNLAQAMLEIAGEEVARQHIQPAAFMHFQAIAFDKIPTSLTYYSGRGVFKKGDFVELLAHQDLLAAISPCPMGDQHELEKYEEMVCHPVSVAIYEGQDGPLETAPDPKQKTMNAVDFVKAGRPGMVVAKVGKEE